MGVRIEYIYDVQCKCTTAACRLQVISRNFLNFGTSANIRREICAKWRIWQFFPPVFAMGRCAAGRQRRADGTARTPSPTERDRTCRRAGPACPAAGYAFFGGTHGSRPTGAYPPKKNNATPLAGRCRQAMSSAAARRRARRSERATGLFFTAGRMATPSSRRQGGSMARTVRFCWA